MVSQNTSIYPIAIDGFQQVPLFVDGMSLITADGINRYRSAIINLESTLGVAPHISEKYQGFSNVSERLDFLDGIVSTMDEKINEITAEDLQGITENGNVTPHKIVVGGLVSSGDVVVDGNISFKTITANLNDLNDVSIDIPSVGDALVWDGSHWSPSKVSKVILEKEEIEDIAGDMFTDAGHIGVTVEYLDDDGKIRIENNYSLDEEEVEDIVGLMFSGGVHTGISAVYDDDLGSISLSNDLDELSELADTDIDAPLDEQILSYDSASSSWKNIDLPDDSVLNVRTISTNDFDDSSGVFDVENSDDLILCDFADGGVTDITLNLPDPGINGSRLIIKDKDSINNLGVNQEIKVIAPAGMLIDGSADFVLDVRRQSITVVCDGSNYWVV